MLDSGYSFHPHLDPPPSAGGGRVRKGDLFDAGMTSAVSPRLKLFSDFLCLP